MASPVIFCALAPAKLNLFLHVVGRRADGYHLLQSVFALLDFGDSVSFGVRADGLISRVSSLQGVPEEMDLVVRAARLLQRESGVSLGVDIAVEKRIPMGGGLGGGSSDAATALLALNRLWKTDWSVQRLQALGLTLGADVPFFVHGHNAWAEGVGEELAVVRLPVWWYVVLVPAAAVPTQFVFQHPELTRNSIPIKIADFSASGLADTRNDLQAVVVKAFPAVAASLAALQAVSQKSIFGARMTGSGACVFAAFATEQDARNALSQLLPDHTGFVAKGLEKHPLCD
jgi:4-diphosphocytidyl-2-C-methyl-D-erythritol kinase